MSDPGLHDRAAGGRLAGPVRAISLMLTPVINRVGLTGAAQWRLSPGREMSAQQAGLLPPRLPRARSRHEPAMSPP